MTGRPRRIAAIAAAAAIACAGTVPLGASASAAVTPAARHPWNQAKPRTVVTTDMEQDDYDSLIRYLLYSDEFDTEGIVYTSSVYHWAGDGKGTKFLSPNPRREYDTPQTHWRWTGDTIIQKLIGRYARVYRNLRAHDPRYPSPRELLRKTKLGNIDFEGEMSHDTAGSNLIKKLLLDDDPRPLYLQAWGGTSTIARALKSIHDQYAGTPRWRRVHREVSAKAVIMASGFQDLTYQNYIAPNWPKLQVRDLSGGYDAWGYYFEDRSPVPKRWRYYFGAEWTKKHILDVGPLGAQYYVWGDGRATPGDPLDTFGDLSDPPPWLPTRAKYDFISEGDDVAFMGLIDTGLRSEPDPTRGGWGGRLVRKTAIPNLWTSAPSDLGPGGKPIGSYDWTRWIPAAQNDFATRLKWSVTPPRHSVNHAPVVRPLTGHCPWCPPGVAGNRVRPRVRSRCPAGHRTLVAVPGRRYLPGRREDHRCHAALHPGHRARRRPARPDHPPRPHRRGHRRHPADPLHPHRPDRPVAASGGDRPYRAWSRC